MSARSEPATYVYQDGPQPCAYCWGFTPPEGWHMENVDVYLPRGDGWVGLAPTHPECWQVVVEYMDELERERKAGLLW